MTPSSIETAPRDGTRILVFVPPQPEDSEPNNTAGENVVWSNKWESLGEWLKFQRGWFTAWFEDENWRTGLRDTIESSAKLNPPSHWITLPPDMPDGMVR